jgi:hypothetical protein
VVVRFVNIDGIVDHHCLKFLFIKVGIRIENENQIYNLIFFQRILSNVYIVVMVLILLNQP